MLSLSQKTVLFRDRFFFASLSLYFSIAPLSFPFHPPVSPLPFTLTLNLPSGGELVYVKGAAVPGPPMLVLPKEHGLEVQVRPWHTTSCGIRSDCSLDQSKCFAASVYLSSFLSMFSLSPSLFLCDSASVAVCMSFCLFLCVYVYVYFSYQSGCQQKVCKNSIDSSS